LQIGQLRVRVALDTALLFNGSKQRRRYLVSSGNCMSQSSRNVAPADKVEVAVCDRETGLPSDKLDKIFQPFYTTKREGLGMGLSISRSIIEAHGGKLWAQNNAGGGNVLLRLAGR
jgi:signal transduction histidine kinase